MFRTPYNMFRSGTPRLNGVRMTLMLLATTLSRLSAAQAADTLRAGHAPAPRIVLTIGATRDEAFLVNNGKTVDGPKSAKETREVKCGAEDCYLVVMTTFSPRGDMVDSVWANRKTFVLVKHVERAPGIHTEVNVANGRIRGVANDSGKAARIIDDAAPAYDFSVAEEIVGNLPLAKNYRTVIHTYDITQGFRDVGVTVVGAESLDTPQGRRLTWIVEMSFGSHKATRWFDQKTHEGVKWQVDMGGGRLMWGQTPAK